MAKDYDGHIDGAEDGKLMGLLEEASFAFEEGTVIRCQPTSPAKVKITQVSEQACEGAMSRIRRGRGQESMRGKGWRGDGGGHTLNDYGRL